MVSPGSRARYAVYVQRTPAARVPKPVLYLMGVPDEEAAIAAANDSEYGLSTSVFTTDEEKAVRIARRRFMQ